MQPKLKISDIAVCVCYLLAKLAIYGEIKPGVPHLVYK